MPHQDSPRASYEASTACTGLEAVPRDVLPRILDAQLAEARQLVARKRELKQRLEEAAMHGRVQAALCVAVTATDPRVARCLRTPGDLETFLWCWYRMSVRRGDFSFLDTLSQVAASAGPGGARVTHAIRMDWRWYDVAPRPRTCTHLDFMQRAHRGQL